MESNSASVDKAKARRALLIALVGLTAATVVECLYVWLRYPADPGFIAGAALLLSLLVVSIAVAVAVATRLNFVRSPAIRWVVASVAGLITAYGMVIYLLNLQILLGAPQ
jgi:Kef-type K+ transport system membrane component KefB